MVLITQTKHVSHAVIGQFVPSIRRGRTTTSEGKNRNRFGIGRTAMWVSLVLFVGLLMAVYGDSVIDGGPGTMIATIGILVVVGVMAGVSALLIDVGRSIRGHRAYERVDLPRWWNR